MKVDSRYGPYQWHAQDFIVEGVQQGPKGQKQDWSLTPSPPRMGLVSAVSSPSKVRGGALATQCFAIF